MSDERDLDERLARLTQATEPLRPGPGFAERVMVEVHARQPGVLDELWVSSRRLLPLAMAAAVLAVGMAWQSESAVNQALAVSYAAPELEW